jgi:hypothetical protein
VLRIIEPPRDGGSSGPALAFDTKSIKTTRHVATASMRRVMGDSELEANKAFTILVESPLVVFDSVVLLSMVHFVKLCATIQGRSSRDDTSELKYIVYRSIHFNSAGVDVIRLA